MLLGSLFTRKTDKSRLDEQLALQVAEMIINDVTTTTRCRDDDPQGVTMTTRSHDDDPACS